MHCMLMDLPHGFEVLSTTEETLFNDYIVYERPKNVRYRDQLWKYETDTAPRRDQNHKPKFETETAKNRFRVRNRSRDLHYITAYFTPYWFQVDSFVNA